MSKLPVKLVSVGPEGRREKEAFVVNCPNCGGCLPYPRDIVVQEKIKLLKELAERLYNIMESINIDASD